MPRTLLVGAVLVCLSGVGCASGPCPRGQELREERYSPTQIKARGCVGKNADGNYRLFGKWEFYYASGQKQAEGVYRDGFEGGERGDGGILVDGREGKWIYWRENGMKEMEIAYRRGKKDGLTVFWHENGPKEGELTYRNGKLEGLAVFWHENGLKRQEGTYRDDKREGVFFFWYPNGQKDMEITYRGGEQIAESTKAWDESGNPK